MVTLHSYHAAVAIDICHNYHSHDIGCQLCCQNTRKVKHRWQDGQSYCIDNPLTAEGEK